MDPVTPGDRNVIYAAPMIEGDYQRPARAAFRQFGGKWSIAPWIASFFPHHKTYVEPFGGAFSVGLSKPPAQREIYTDLDENPCNFFQQLQQYPDALIAAIANAPKTLEEFNGYRQGSFEPLEWAKNYYMYCQLSWMGGGGRWNSGTSSARVNRCSRGSDDHLQMVAARVRNLEILNGSVSGAFVYDSPSTLFYLDPPYPHEARASKDSRHKNHDKSMPRRQYRYEMTDADHIQLSHQIDMIEGMVIISGYDCPLYRELFGDWVTVSKAVRTSARTEAIEYLYLSPTVVNALPPEQIFDFHSIELAPGEGRYAPNFPKKLKSINHLPPEHFSKQTGLKEHLNRLVAECDRIKSEGHIAAPGSYIERYIARRRRKKSAAVEYVYYRLRNPSGEGPKHQNLGKKGSPKYQAATESISRRNQISQLRREIKIVEKQLAKVLKANVD